MTKRAFFACLIAAGLVSWLPATSAQLPLTPAAPHQLTAADYLGPDGQGDQGEFVILTFDRSTEHHIKTAYRIWREVKVYFDEQGELPQPKPEWIPWAAVVAPEEADSVLQVVVATLDNEATNWAVSAERQYQPTDNRLELIYPGTNETNQGDTLFATSTAQAVFFVTNGVALTYHPYLPTVWSDTVYTPEPARAIDNIPPEPIWDIWTDANAASGSIVVKWRPSADDQLVSWGTGDGAGPSWINYLGLGVSGYEIQRAGLDGQWQLIGSVPAGDSVFVDESVKAGEWYRYHVGARDRDNVIYTDTDWFTILPLVTNASPTSSRPEKFALGENYPNPFNPTTSITYGLPQTTHVTLSVYNVVGQVIRTLVDQEQAAGHYLVQWEGDSEAGQTVGAGVFFYALHAGEFHATRKMLLLK